MWRIANDFIHDTCTGLWLASLVVILVLHAQAAGMPAEALQAIAKAQALIWWLLVVALVGLALTGSIRLSYWRSQTSPGELAAKRAMLAWKHVTFIVVYGVGSVWAHSLLLGAVAR